MKITPDRGSHVVLLLCTALLSACTGLSGHVYERRADGSIGPVIANAELTFIKEDGSAAFTASSAANGRYSIDLGSGRYYWRVTHPDFADDTSAPGFAVVTSGVRGTANIFLRAPDITTVVIVRHAEKQNPDSNVPTEPLSAAGQVRASQLRETLLRGGASAVFSTDTTRTRDTVGPLAGLFHMPLQIYSNPTTLAGDVLVNHRGDTVLVAAHSDTVATVANAFGAQVPATAIGDFDNLYLVSIAGAQSNVVNLQYAADSTPDLTKNDRHAMTLLLVGTAAVGAEPQELLHTARKAGVSAIFSSVAANGLVAPLATQLGLAVQSFNGNDVAGLIADLIANHQQDTMIVAGSPDELRGVIRQLNAAPFPVIYATDTDHLIVVTRFPSGAARVTALRF